MISNPSLKPAFTELAPVNHTQVANNAWEDFDLSASIPAGCLAVVVSSVPGVAGNKGVRNNGSALSRYVSNSGAGFCHTMWTGKPDSNRLIETYAATNEHFYLVGYWL